METLELPYLKHLAFANERQYKLNSAYNFEQLYGRIEGGESGESLMDDCAKSIDSINHIFDELDPQATLEREKLFLQDLRKHSLRLLNEDIKVFFNRRKNAGETRPHARRSKEDTLKFIEQKFLLDKIPDTAVAKINKSIAGLVTKFRENAKLGKTKREELSQNTGLVVRHVVNILNTEFEANGVLDVISKYMGIDMCATGLSIELSVPGANWWRVDYSVYEKAPKTLYYHFDESIAYPKAIVYLNDVSEKNGATSCAPSFVKGSKLTHLQFLIGRAITCVGKEAPLKDYYNHKYHQTFGCPVFRGDFSRLPDELRFSSHFGWDVIPDSALESFLVQDEKKVVGKAGTFIAFDGGQLAHRGGMIAEGDRVALQVVFGERLPLYKKVGKKLKQLMRS